MFFRNSLILFSLFILSCQTIEFVEPIEIDYSKFNKISISAKEIFINIDYNSAFSEENIEDQLDKSPLEIVSSWNKKNIKNIGNENKFYINIIDASISKKEIENIDAKKYEEKTIFQYQVFFLIEYNLYDNSDFLLANTTVESTRSTTSQKYISLNETELIINELLINTLKDFTIEAKSQLTTYMNQYIIN